MDEGKGLDTGLVVGLGSSAKDERITERFFLRKK